MPWVPPGIYQRKARDISALTSLGQVPEVLEPVQPLRSAAGMGLATVDCGQTTRARMEV